jgi:cellulose synthase operon protein C
MRSCLNKNRVPEGRYEYNPVLGAMRFSCGIAILTIVLLLGNSFAWTPTVDNKSLGQAALRSGEYAKAQEYFVAALKDSAAPEESRAGLLQTLRETGAYEEAVKRSEEFLSSFDGSSLLHLERGRIAEILGDYANAEKHYRRSLSLASTKTPLRMDAAIELAGLLDTTGRRGEAVSLWDKLLDEYRSGSVQGSRSLGDIAVAAWKSGYVPQDAVDIFMDATDEKLGGELSLEALSNFGYLFLDKYRPTEALGVFRDCLKINKAYPDALIGIALAKKYDSDFEAETYARAALEINPNFVPALNLLAELALDEEDRDAAIGEINKALRVNPVDLKSLSLKAVYHYFHSDNANFALTEKKVLEINPSYGNFYYILAESLVSRRKYQGAVEFNRKAVALDPELWAAYNSLGMNLTRIGEMEEGRKAIEKAFKGDQSNVWAYNSLNLFDQLDTFVQSRSENFKFLMAKEDAPVLSSFAPALAEEAYSKLTERYGFKPQGPLQLEIFPDHGGFAVRTLGLPGLGGALGVCFGKVLAINSPRVRDAGDFNWGSTLWHEFTHVITLQMSNYNIPRWYSEGLSVFEEHRARPGWGDKLTLAFVKAYKEGRLLKASQLNSGIMHPQTPEQIMFSYYQAGMFCEMVEEKFGFDKIRQSLLLFAENKSVDEVFRRTLGLDPAGIDAEYAHYMDSRIKDIASRLNFQLVEKTQANIDKGVLTQLLEKNPDDFIANLQMGALLRKEGDNANAETCLKKAKHAFPQFAEEGNPYQLLGLMYLELNRENDALSEFTAWSRLDGDTALPLLKAADIYGKRKDWDSVAKMLALSIYVNPYEQDIQKRLGDASMESGRWPEAVTSYQALVGLNGTDRAGAHYDLARALLASGNKQQAKREVLRSLEIAPTYRNAQELLLKLTGANQ